MAECPEIDHTLINSTVGAMIAGCMVSVGLSSICGFQTFLYFQVFSSDAFRYKLLVVWIWLNDAAHTVLICVTIWHYTVANFGNEAALIKVIPVLAGAVAINTVTTLTVNTFYGWRIYKMSRRNWSLMGLITLLCIARTALALGNLVEIINLGVFPEITARFDTLVISGLAVSAATDVVISLARYYYLRNLKQGYTGSVELLDSVVIFTINDSFLTCAVVIAAIICLVQMPNNFIWLSIYFTLAKFYSNSALATLNLRNWFRHRPRPMGIPLTRPQVLGNGQRRTMDDKHSVSGGMDPNAHMEVFVDQQVEYNVGVHFMEDQKHHLETSKSVGIAA